MTTEMKLIESIEPNHLITIEWQMMDPSKYLPLSLANAITLRTLLYPLTVIKTRMQVQKQYSVYKGTFDAAVKIVKFEGVNGLYKGFLVNTFQVGAGFCYILTYEKVKDTLTRYQLVKDSSVKSLIGGGIGSVVSQTIVLPFDVISQHKMVISGSKSSGPSSFSTLSNPLTLNHKEVKNCGLTVAIIKELRRKDGFKGFYRGYFASLSCYVPSSALWWFFYEKYSPLVHATLPADTWHLMIRSCAAIMSGATTAVLTNPLDVVRANFQIQRLDSYSATVKKLWSEERFNLFYKGLTARLTQNCIASALVSVGYETLKRLSLRQEYEDKVKW